MTGPEHFAAAEDAIRQANSEDNWTVKSYFVAAANASALLAMASATAEAAQLTGYGAEDPE
jgi:hypothetical protein